jgi:aldose 1-epimerase
MSVQLKIDSFGTVENPITKKQNAIKRFTWTNKNGTSVAILSYGATIQSIKVPDRNGKVEDIVMGFDDIAGYRQANNPFFGAFVGRVANRIRRGEFTLNGEAFTVSKNRNNNHLHGGNIGFDKYNFNHHVDGNVVYLSHLSPDGNEGYPGDVLTTVKCELRSDNSLVMTYQATSSKPTPVNLTNHSYFNLAGHASGYEEINKHVININADKITETDSEFIPTGKLLDVAGTPFDLRTPVELGPAMKKLTRIGYDNNFCITVPSKTSDSLNFVTRVVHPGSGRFMEVYSNQEGVQFYTGSGLPDPPVVGKGGAQYQKLGAFCLETQKFPDAVNHDNFPSTIVNPGQVYSHDVVFQFGHV